MTVYKSKLPEITLKYKSGEIYKSKISSSEDLFKVMYEMFNADTLEYNEEMIVVFLNGANNTIGWMKHSTGGTSQTIVDVKMLLASTLQCGAASIAIAHNHPSGQRHPSREDDKVTQRIKTGCEAIGVRFLDHVIICGDNDNNYYSFADEGKI